MKAIRPARNFKTPLQYDERYCDEIVNYFEDAPLTEQAGKITTVDDPIKGQSLKTEVRAVCARMPTFEFFARSIGTSAGTMRNWEARHPEFAAACERAREIQHEWLFQQGLSDRVQPAAFEFVATNVTSGRLIKGAQTVVSVDAKSDPRPELASVPAQDLERMKEISAMLQRGLSSADRAEMDAMILASRERALVAAVDAEKPHAVEA